MQPQADKPSRAIDDPVLASQLRRLAVDPSLSQIVPWLDRCYQLRAYQNVVMTFDPIRQGEARMLLKIREDIRECAELSR